MAIVSFSFKGDHRWLECDNPASICDGVSTFDELYWHRHALFIALANSHPQISWKSRFHANGGYFGSEWFWAGMRLSTGGISYPLPAGEWDLLCVPTVINAPRSDGHIGKDVIYRLLDWSQQYADRLEVSK